jgi:hypothetical protein
MTVVTLASRRAAPISPQKRVFIPTTQATELHLIQLHAQACTSLREALRQLQAPTAADGTSIWAAATARATRGLSALKQGCALSNCVEG